MCRKRTNQRITTLFNMGISTLIAVCVGVFMQWIFGAGCYISGFVAISAVITEHYLTLYPSAILKYILLPEKDK